MLKFIVGGPGSGKTENIVNSIKDDLADAKKVLLIVPEQDALSTERRITEAMPASKNLLNLEISNFRRLPNLVFRALGGLSSQKVDKSGLCVLMWRALCELSDTLGYYNKTENLDAGLISDLIALFSEFSDYNITPEKLETATLYLNGALKQKITDLAMIYTRYLELRSGNYLDASDEMRKAAAMLEKENIFADTNVYIDSFTGFTPCELDLIEVLTKGSEQMTVSLCIDRERDTEIFENIIDTKRKLSELAVKNGISIEETVCMRPERPKDIELFTQYAFDYFSTPDSTNKCKNIDVYNCIDAFAECELVCADIAKEIRGGMRYRDIRIVAGSLSDYEGILEPILRKHNIPCHFTEREDICSHPILKFLICALNIISYNYQIDDVMNFLKTGYSPIGERDCYLIEEYLSLWGIKGRAWKSKKNWTLNPLGMTEKTTEYSESKLEKINSVRYQIVEIISEFEKSLKKDKSSYSTAKSVYEFLCSCIDYKKLEKKDAEVWNTLVSVLEQISYCAPENEIDNPQTLKKLIKLCASVATYSQIPSVIDEIGCYSSNSMRGGECKKVYLIGVNEGSFPMNIVKGGLLLKNDKDILRNECKIKLSGISKELETEGVYNLYRSVLCATKRVWISFCKTDTNGSEIFSSVGVSEIKRLFGEGCIKSDCDYPRSLLIYDIASAAEFINSTDVVLRNTAKSVLLNSEYAFVADTQVQPLSQGECHVTPSSEKENINVSYSRLDNFVQCPFKYEMENVIKLNEHKKIEYDPRDIGNFIHYLLETYLRENCEKLAKGDFPSSSEVNASVDQIVNSYIDMICSDVSMMPNRILAMFERLRQKAKIFVYSLLVEFKTSDFKPVFFELPISSEGDGISPYVIKNSDGTTTTVYGQIDRVDAFEKDGKLYFRIVDYKTGSKEFKPEELKEGINLQMFLYLFSIMADEKKFNELLGSSAEPVPCGVIYYMAKYSPVESNHLTDIEEIEKKIIKSIDRFGMVIDDDEIIDAMAKTEDKTALLTKIRNPKAKNSQYYKFNVQKLTAIKNDIVSVMSEISDGIKSGNVAAEPKNQNTCNYCRLKPICRKEKDEDE